MNVSAWSIRNPIPAAMLFVLLTFAGLLSFHAMKIQNLPDVDLPAVTVTTLLPGAAPTQLENEVVRKLENSIATIQGIRHITSRIQDGIAIVNVQFRLEKPVQEAVDDVRSAVEKTRPDLPADIRGPIVTKLDLAAQPILSFAVSAPAMTDEDLSWFVDDTITRRLLNLPGVGAVARVGGVNRQVHVDLDPQALQALGATAAGVSQQLRQMQSDSTGGRAELGSAEQPMRTLAATTSADALARLQIPLPDGRRVALSDIATVRDTIEKPHAAAFLDGKPVVGFEVSRSRGASEVEVGMAVHDALSQLQASHPGLTFTESFNFVEPVRNEYEGSMRLLYEGAILAVIVVWLFLRDWRATFISAIALPMSVIPAFLGMYLQGFSVNLVTLLALSLVVGILVDDAIVEVENIVRHLRMGKSPYQAAMEAADEIGLAVIATTFTLIAVFLPTAFMSGIAGRFFKQFGWTASLAVFASLVVARMLTPMMSAYLLKPAASHQEVTPRWIRSYLRVVRWSLEHRFFTMFLALLFFVGSVALIPLLPTGFIPPDDGNQTQVRLTLPPGASLQQTTELARLAEQRLIPIQAVRGIYSTIGAGSASADLNVSLGEPETREAVLTLTLEDRSERPRKQIVEQRIRQALEDLPGARIGVGLGGWGEKYILVLAGNDPDTLTRAANRVERELRSISGIGSIASSANLMRPEIIVTPDVARASDLGVTSAAISETLRVATLGDYDQALPKLNLPQRQIPIVVKLDASAMQDLDVLSRLAVPSTRPGNEPVQLGQVASLALAGGPTAIDRYDRLRNVQFTIELAGESLGTVKSAVMALPAIQSLPPGVSVAEVGDADLFSELFTSFGLAMLTGVLCIYVVLVLLFKDFLHPVTILCALPLSLGGAFVGLMLKQQSLSMPSLIGLIMLMGIATKNSILLVEYAILARRDHGLTRMEALLDACRKRARPIIMTSLAMGAGMMPIALGLGIADASFRSPMAVAVIGGLITSTILSLLVIPAVFTIMDDIGAWIRRQFTGASRTASAG